MNLLRGDSYSIAGAHWEVSTYEASAPSQLLNPISKNKRGVQGCEIEQIPHHVTRF